MAPSFLDRADLTFQAETLLRRLLQDGGIEVISFGQESILAAYTSHKAQLKRMLISQYSFDEHTAGFMLKFAPDLICYSKKKNIEPFFIDVKASQTPILFEATVGNLQNMAKDAGISPIPEGYDIGVIEREAWDVYTRIYPRTRVAICYVAPYVPAGIKLEWCSKIKSFYRYHENRNTVAGGSGTPHVNLHLGKMRTVQSFFSDEFDVRLRTSEIESILSVVRSWPIEKPNGRVNWRQFADAVIRYSKACPWIKGKFPEEHGGVMSVTQTVAWKQKKFGR